MSIEEDRISELPDSILVNEILSRLSTKCSLRTTLLSKRWRWLWTNVPALKFSHTSYTGSGLDKAKATLFMDYVDVVLLRHQTSNLRSFKLVCDETIPKSLVYSWISAVAHPKLHELYVDFCGLEHYVIPSSVYCCRSLKVLRLSFQWSVFKPPITSVSLPSLASLELRCANFVDENLTQQFISSLPALELLVLRECYFYNHHELVISAPSLKVLTLSKAYFKPNELGNWRIKICAPKLYQLYCQTDKLPREYILDVPVLQHAWIHPEKWDNTILTKEGVRGTACDLLKQIAHVKKLGITADLLMVLPHEDLLNRLPTFTNLTCLLVLQHCWGRDLLSILRIMPNLEDLRVNKVHASSADDMTLHIGETLPSCFESKIKIFQCIYQGLPGDLHMIDFLLRNIAAFEIIEIVDEEFLSHPIKIVKLGRHSFIPDHRPLCLLDLQLLV